MINMAIIDVYEYMAGKNVETIAAAVGAFSFVWNSLTYEKILACKPEALKMFKFYLIFRRK